MSFQKKEWIFKKYYLWGIVLFLFLWLISTITAAILNQSYRWYKVWSSIFGVINGGEYWSTATNTRFTRIKEFDICKVISNSGSTAVFIPTKTIGEWTGFLTYKPGTIAINECGCYTDSDCNAGQTCNGETTAINPYCQWTFSVPTTTYSCQSNWQATPQCWKDGYTIMAGDIDDCTIQWGLPGYYFNGDFYNAMMYCMMDESSSQWSDLICPYQCGGLSSSQCTSPQCTWASSTSYQTYNCNQAVTTTTARCAGKEVPLSEQHCYTSLSPISPMVVASDYWDCVGQWNYRAFYFNGQYYNASNSCMMEAWEGGEVRCFYPCRWLTQSQCTVRPTQCERTTTTTTVSPNECWDRAGCSRNSWSMAQPGTCITAATCWSANGGTYSSLTSTSPNLCIGATAINFTWNNFGWTRKCWTASCMAEKDISASSCVPWTPLACFVAGTQVRLTDGTITNIEKITKGMTVLGADNKEQVVEQPLKIRYTGKLYAINGSDYFVTASHPFMTTEGWKSFDPDLTKNEIPGLTVTRLEIGDIFVKETGLEQLYSTDYKEVNTYVYNLVLNNDHTYYADGYLVHNKYDNGHACTWNVSCGSNYCTAWVCDDIWSPSVNACCSCDDTAQCPTGYSCSWWICSKAGVACQISTCWWGCSIDTLEQYGKIHYIEWLTAGDLLSNSCSCIWAWQELYIYNATMLSSCTTASVSNWSVKAVCNGDDSRSFPQGNYTSSYTYPCINNITDPMWTNMCHICPNGWCWAEDMSMCFYNGQWWYCPSGVNDGMKCVDGKRTSPTGIQSCI